jgi:hypothetical protein
MALVEYLSLAKLVGLDLVSSRPSDMYCKFKELLRSMAPRLSLSKLHLISDMIKSQSLNPPSSEVNKIGKVGIVVFLQNGDGETRIMMI